MRRSRANGRYPSLQIATLGQRRVKQKTRLSRCQRRVAQPHAPHRSPNRPRIKFVGCRILCAVGKGCVFCAPANSKAVRLGAEGSASRRLALRIDLSGKRVNQELRPKYLVFGIVTSASGPPAFIDLPTYAI